MKTILSLGLALIAIVPAQAQIFRPAAINGALLGGAAGAIIGNNSGSLHHNAWQGAAIGAGAGLLLGATIGDSRDDIYVQRRSPVTYRSYDYPSYSYYSHRSGYSGYSGYYTRRPDYRGTGLFWGGVTGAIVGNNSRSFGHNAWRGAAWGAGLGYIFGSIAESNARYREVEVQPAPVIVQAPAPAPAPAAQPQQVTIINNYYNTPAPMASANSMFGRN